MTRNIRIAFALSACLALSSAPLAAGEVDLGPGAATVEIAFSACRRISPDDCENRRIVNEGGTGLMACMTTAQAHLAKWVNEHPAYRVARWRCLQTFGRARDA